jgi:hypothetical protein
LKSFNQLNKWVAPAVLMVAAATSVNRMPGIIDAPSAVPTGDQADTYNRVIDTFNPDSYLDDYIQTEQASESDTLPEATEAETQTQVSGI